MASFLQSVGGATIVGILRLIQSMPRPLAWRLTRRIIRLIVRLMPRLRQVGRRNLEVALPDLTVAEREKILEESIDVIASNAFNLARLADISISSVRQNSNLEQQSPLVEDLSRRAKPIGVLWVSAHFGQFELLMPLKGWFFNGGSGIARPFGLPRLDLFWNALRESTGSKILARKGAFNEVLRELNQGRDVALLFDQNVKSNHAIFSRLFGVEAATARSTALASIRTGAPLLFATLISTRRPEDLPHFELRLEEVETADLADLETEEQVQLITDRLNQLLERAVRVDPKQWFWIHRRFKTRPKGEPETFYSAK